MNYPIQNKIAVLRIFSNQKGKKILEYTKEPYCSAEEGMHVLERNENKTKHEIPTRVLPSMQKLTCVKL